MFCSGYRCRSAACFCLLVSLLFVVACSGDDNQPWERADQYGNVTAGEPNPLPLASPSGCVIDDDCQPGNFCFQNTCSYVCASDADCDGGACSERGQCVADNGALTAGVVQTLPNIAIVEYPAMVYSVSGGEQNISFTFRLNATLPPEGLAYRIWRSDGESDQALVQHVRGDDTFTITVAPGAASANNDEPRDVAITLFTAIGDIDLYLTPAATFAGAWRGRAFIEEFGGQSFGIDLHILGEGTDDLQVALPLNRASLFAPHRDVTDDNTYQVVSATYHPGLNVYQAVFRHTYDFGNGLFAALPAGQVERMLRFDFDADALANGELRGRFADYWIGLYDHQRTSGQLQRGDLYYTGDITFDRAGALPSGITYEAGAPSDEQVPSLVGLQPIVNCDPSYFDVDPITDGDITYSCDGIEDALDFDEADATTRALCATAVSRSADEQDTTADQLSAYFTDQGNVEGLSFEQFLQSCADDNIGPCMPRPEALCAYELTAHALRDITDASIRDDLLFEFVDSSREAFLARQLGAFYIDMELRRDWLRQSSAPTVFLNEVEQANLALLDEWEERVLDVHAEIFADFFSPNAVTALGRATDNAELNEIRRSLLFEASTLWRTYAAALRLAAHRWNDILKNQNHRDQRVADLQIRAQDLYLTMGLLTEFSRAAGANSQSAALAGDFIALTDAINALSKSFDDTFFARDAEIVTARSLDPLSDNDSLLSERRQAALQAIDDARQGIDDILDEADMEALQEQELRTRLENERREAANTVARICGLPVGCTEIDLLTNPACLDVRPGACGLLAPADPNSDVVFDPQYVAASLAGSAILDILEAFHNVQIQKDELEGHLQILDLEYQELDAFRRDVESWNQLRLDGVRQLEQNLAQRQSFRDDRIEELMTNIQERAGMRQDTINQMTQRFAEWNRFRIDETTSTFATNMEILGLRRGADSAELASEQAAALLDAKAEGLPTSNGTSNDLTSVARAAFWLSARTLEFGGQHVGMQLNYEADILASRLERDGALAEASLSAMQEQAELADAIGDAELDAVIDQMELSNQLTEDEIARLEEIIELMEAQLAAELAYQRDMSEFRTRRTRHLQNHVHTSGKLLRLEKSRFNVIQRTTEYDGLVQQARLEAARLYELDQQLTDLDQLVGGLGTIFAQSQQLERTERHLMQARDALMDWLVVLEYYAVRPFFAERTQILLARNAYQLEAIADRLRGLEQTCGGSERSSSTTVLSLRRDILGLTRSIENEATSGPISPDERFRRWLTQSHIPIDRRLRWSTSSSLSNVLGRTNGVLAATFALRLDNFANLTLACNAKIESISAQVVGDVGDVRPTISLLYDGTSQLRSCQPDIDQYVRAYGQGTSNYGTITNLRTAGRSMSPLAGVNEFPNTNRDANRTLAGLPVASEYTLLIDTELGDNASLDWSQLEDIRFEISYSYQDLFPTACD